MKPKYKKYLEGRASAKEQKEILSHIKSSDENLNDFQNHKEDWKKGDDKLISLSTWNAWKRIENEINPAVKINKKWMFAAASILIMIIASSGLFLSNQSQQNFVAIQTKAGQLTNIVLPDSTEVDINSASNIIYSTSWFGLKRKVELNGEAYFHVNSKVFSDFDVICNDVKVNVTGTRFNVKAYDNEIVEVVLEEGSVNFSLLKNKDIVQHMAPGDMIIYNPVSHRIIKKTVESKDYTSWKNGVLYFENNKLPDLLKSIERRYNVKFKELSNPVLKELTLTFTIRDEKFEKVMELIKTALPIKINTKGEMIEIELDNIKYQKVE